MERARPGSETNGRDGVRRALRESVGASPDIRRLICVGGFRLVRLVRLAGRVLI